MKLDIIFENENFIAINKPSGMLSIPDRTQSEVSLKDLLLEKYGAIFIVHRIDKFTSGLIIFAKNAETHKQLSQLFEGREVEKFYIGLLNGTLYPSSGTISAPVIEHPSKKGLMATNAKGKPSVTDYETIETFKNYSLVQFQIHTGRTHQIRVHTQCLGHSLVGDELYGDGKFLLLSSIKRKFNLSKNQDEEKPLMARLALHSYKINFTLNGEQYSLEAPLPKDFTATLQQLRKNNA
ncbi:RNA pseudouridine synthase [Arachidicoccus ginsenosidimutans]|uniref:RluA family pseudouridine synthase n=1 Tax=Arachidicoccus sp. BS20 TaxID=1850526 RepID=UPI0007F14896|nr:RluA family pseudouridine synthase [Arachidicoccus sp. BS20]ANI88132.1 RNA pseudouridine synthase [Arachidicoccus sp. BS20]